MTDIVERLRARILKPLEVLNLLPEAADEIGRLRTENEQLRAKYMPCHTDSCGCTFCAEVAESEKYSRSHRLELARLLQVNEAIASAEDMVLCARVQAAAKGDGFEFDRALASPNVAALFERGVLFFGRN